MIDSPLRLLIEVFYKAFIRAEKENAPEIGVDHLLAALDIPTAERQLVEPSPGKFKAAPRRYMRFSSEATAAIEAANALAPSGLEYLTVDSLRTALLAFKRDHGGLS